jgi:PAN domain
MRTRLVVVFWWSAVAVMAQDVTWWQYPTRAPVGTAGCAVVRTDDALYAAVTRANVEPGWTQGNFPRIAWGQRRALVVTSPAGTLQLPLQWTVSSLFGLARSDAGRSAVVVVDAPAVATSCRVQMLAQEPQNNALYIEVDAKSDHSHSTPQSGKPGPVKLFDPSQMMAALDDGVAFLPVAGEHSRRAESPQACSDFCEADTVCRAVTFDKSKSICWLKPLVGGTGASPDMVSAKKVSAANAAARAGR